MGRVEGPADVAFAEFDDPLREIPHVDGLSLPLGRRRGEDLASACEAVRPVREAAGRIVRADDQPGANDESAFAQFLQHNRLAQRLEWPVAVVRDLAVREVTERRQRTVLVDRPAEVGVDGDSRDEAVATRVSQCLGGGAHDLGQVAARVDHGVPRSPGQRAEIACAIAA